MNSLWLIVTGLAAFLVAYRFYGAFLAAKFPEHAAWTAVVPRFWPRLRPAGPAGSRFEWSRVGINREWRTCLAIPVGFALLALRARLGGW